IDSQSLRSEYSTDARVVRHLGKCSRIRSAASAAARTAVVCRLVRVVEADRTMTDDENEWRQSAEAIVVQDARDDRRHLYDSETRMLAYGRWRVIPVQLQPRSAGARCR